MTDNNISFATLFHRYISTHEWDSQEEVIRLLLEDPEFMAMAKKLVHKAECEGRLFPRPRPLPPPSTIGVGTNSMG